MNMKEDELVEVQEQLEKYQILLQTMSGSVKSNDNVLIPLQKLFKEATGRVFKLHRSIVTRVMM